MQGNISPSSSGDREPEQQQSFLTLLPKELLVRIFSYLHPCPLSTTLLPLRAVHPTFRDLIDEHFAFSVIVNEDRRPLPIPACFKVKDLLINKLSSPPTDLLLSRPEILKTARFWGEVHSSAFWEILSQACNLEELSLTMNSLIAVGRGLGREEKIALTRLTKLEILGEPCREVSEEVKLAFKRLLNKLEIPNLKRIIVKVTAGKNHTDEMVMEFFRFLRQAMSLTHVNFSLNPLPGRVVPQRRLDLNGLLLPEQLSSLQLSSLRLDIGHTYFNTWLPLIQSQAQLTDLRIHFDDHDRLPHEAVGIPITHLLPCLTQSAPRLTVIELRDICLRDPQTLLPAPLDANVFRAATNLKKLILVRSQEDCALENLGPSSSLINLNLELPFLEELKIVRFNVLSSDLEVLIQSGNLKNVKLQHTGGRVGQGQGVDPGILETLLCLPEMQILDVFPISLGYAELQKLKALAKPIHCMFASSGNHFYFKGIK